MDHTSDIAARLATGNDRPAFYKAVGIGLAVGSGAFIGTSFVLKKVGLLKANDKYNEVAGEGYGYLKNFYWWAGMTLMIIGEICNFVAYAFTDAILVTPLGALSVVITTVLSAIFLKERLSIVGKVACFLCIVGSVVIVLHAPQESSVSNIQEMQHFMISPGFLTYAGIIIVGSIAVAWFVAPKYGNKNMLVYISICSWVGGLSVVCTQGLGASIIAWIGGQPQYKEPFLWVLFVFVIGTLLTEIIYLNKALNLFNAAMVTPTYYVYFTSTTIITSSVLFRGFKGTPQDIITVVLGFLVICSGVVLLQLSKSAKDVPDTAVFRGDLDQIQTIAEQEQPETEPKADAIRGAAAIVRRISQVRMRMEHNELQRLHEEKSMDGLGAISEDGQPVQYEWDGLRRRKTLASRRGRAVTAPGDVHVPIPTFTPPPPSEHPPLGMSYFPTEDELEATRPTSRPGTMLSSIVGSIRGRARTNATMPPSYGDEDGKLRSPGIRAVPLSDIPPHPHSAVDEDLEQGTYFPRQDYHYHQQQQHHISFDADTAYRGARADSTATTGSGTTAFPGLPSNPSPAKRQFSFNRVFRKSPDNTEEERLGLVKEEEQKKRGGSGSRERGDQSRSRSREDELHAHHDGRQI